MKKNVFILGLLAFVVGFGACKTQKTKNETVMADTSENALDWAGIYSGTLPCADCIGIQTKLILKKDGSYVVESKYEGKSDEVFRNEGKFKWNKEGNKITLQDGDGVNPPSIYLIGENKAVVLDEDGNTITGDLANLYVLPKVNTDLVEKYWKLVEVFGKPVSTDSGNMKEAHLILKIDGNRVNGNGGCNGFFGSYELKDGNRITFSKMASTMMACPNMDTESQFLKALEMTDSYYLDGDKLTFNRARMAPLARFEAVYLK